MGGAAVRTSRAVRTNASLWAAHRIGHGRAAVRESSADVLKRFCIDMSHNGSVRCSRDEGESLVGDRLFYCLQAWPDARV